MISVLSMSSSVAPTGRGAHHPHAVLPPVRLETDGEGGPSLARQAYGEGTRAAFMKTVTTEKLHERWRQAEAARDRYESGTLMWMQAQDLAEDAHRAYLQRVDEIKAGNQLGKRRTG